MKGMTQAQQVDLTNATYIKRRREKKERIISHARSGLLYPATQCMPSKDMRKEIQTTQAEIMET